MIQQHWTEEPTGLYAIPELVGRNQILTQIDEVLKAVSPTLRILFLMGDGGIGKTRILTEVLRKAVAVPKVRAAKILLDLYHVSLHTPIGLAGAVYQALTPPFDCLQKFENEYRALNRMRLIGEVGNVSDSHSRTLDVFTQDFQRLCEKQRVFLVLDTAERAVYGLSGWTEQIPLAGSLDWLTNQLNINQNLVLLIAGRHTAKPLVERLKDKFAKAVDVISVGSFNIEESHAYFNAVAKIAGEKGAHEVAERVNQLPREIRESAHAYAQGRPILLSLLIDYLSVAGPGQLPTSLHAVQTKPVSEEVRNRFENELINRLLETRYKDTILALGRVPKGADKELLAELLQIRSDEAQQRLKEVQRFSFIKLRPTDQRVFLHDEVYDILQRQVYGHFEDAQANVAAFEAIKTYYTSKRNTCIQQLGELYAPVELQGRERLDLGRLAEVHAQRQTILTEMMFYFLRQDFGRGFRTFYRYSHEAIVAHDILMDMQLQAELLDFVSRYPQTHFGEHTQNEITPGMLSRILQLRPILRDWAGNNYIDGIEKANTLMQKVTPEWEKEFPLALAALHVWTASLHTLVGKADNIFQAHQHLDLAFNFFLDEAFINQSVEDLVKTMNDKYTFTEIWCIKAVLALGYRFSGYLQRVRGFMQKAVTEYGQAATLLRQIDLRVELAQTLNDRGFALAGQGQWHDGRALVYDALRLRRELGPRLPVAFSLNTLALIDVYEGQYISAEEHAERALAISRALSDQRGTGLALIALAEARRRQGVTAPLLEPESRVNLLRQARDNAREALGLFMETQERSRQVEALIEIGCACRDWVRLRIDYPNPTDDFGRLSAESEDAFRRAIEIAKEEGILYREIDARVNLAWLHYYLLRLDPVQPIGDSHPLMEAINEAKGSIPLNSDGSPNIEPSKTQVMVWTRIGKLHTLQGHLEFYILNQISKEQRKTLSAGRNIGDLVQILERIAENYATGLEYNLKYAPDFQGIRRAKEEIYERLNSLNDVELKIVCRKIRSMFPEGSVMETFLRNRTLWQE